MKTADKLVWTISKCILDVKRDGEFTVVKKIPIGESQDSIINDWNGTCTIEQAQAFLNDRYPGHIVLSVRKI